MSCLSLKYLTEEPAAAIWLLVLVINGFNLYFCYKLWRRKMRNRDGYRIQLILPKQKQASLVEKQYLNSIIVNALVLIPNSRVNIV